MIETSNIQCFRKVMSDTSVAVPCKLYSSASMACGQKCIKATNFCKHQMLVKFETLEQKISISETKVEDTIGKTLSILSTRISLPKQVIILDEAHERSLQTDILFSLVKAAQVTASLHFLMYFFCFCLLPKSSPSWHSTALTPKTTQKLLSQWLDCRKVAIRSQK